MKILISLFSIMMLSSLLNAATIMRQVEYKDGDVTLKGWVAFDDAAKGPMPGVLIIHEWWGLTDYPKTRARQLVQLGYVVFCADMYGDGKSTDSWEEAPKLAGPFWQDADLFPRRGNLALAELKKQPNVDTTRLAAIGYCFGGMGVLELARSGADIKGVVSFHGGLKTMHPGWAKNIKGKILVCNGEADPFIAEDEIPGFKAEMDSAKVQYTLINYPEAMHAFTNPKRAVDKEKGVGYNEAADKKSWEDMKIFFAEIFKKE